MLYWVIVERTPSMALRASRPWTGDYDEDVDKVLQMTTLESILFTLFCPARASARARNVLLPFMSLSSNVSLYKATFYFFPPPSPASIQLLHIHRAKQNETKKAKTGPLATGSELINGVLIRKVAFMPS